MERASAAGQLAWWLNAVLCHAVAPDDAVPYWGASSVQLFDAGTHGAPVGWALALAPLRTAGIRRLTVRFVEPGDPAGLPGPAELTRLAVEQGVALVADPAQVVFVPVGGTDRWRCYPATPHSDAESPLGTLAEARQLMRSSMAELTAALPGLDPDDTALAEIATLRAFRGPRPPRGVDPRAAQTACDALRVWWLTRIAGDLAERRELVVPAGLAQLRPLARRAASVAFSEPVVSGALA